MVEQIESAITPILTVVCPNRHAAVVMVFQRHEPCLQELQLAVDALFKAVRSPSLLPGGGRSPPTKRDFTPPSDIPCGVLSAWWVAGPGGRVYEICPWA